MGQETQKIIARCTKRRQGSMHEERKVSGKRQTSGIKGGFSRMRSNRGQLQKSKKFL